ncbi:heavy metal-associated isoprenylated plant protein 47-like [Nymphaea colorata]|nr:heavy metal-associated isoprenylated plant protein 47-like [Nymphaea colorata]
MKQKLVLHVDMFDEKRRSKAMKTAVGAEGVSSVALDGKDKRKLVVIGEDMNAYELVKSLRKNFMVDMESLEKVKSEKNEEKPEEKKAVEQWPYVYQPTVPQHIVYQEANPNCPIM